MIAVLHALGIKGRASHEEVAAAAQSVEACFGEDSEPRAEIRPAESGA